jgi:hypothetical protein
VWIKAVNNAGASGFSPSGRGIPWAAGEAPAAPGRPVIIPGVNLLTINWEETGGAVSYEVFINTAPTVPAASAVTTEKTSVVIGNLENDVTYLIWVRAVNNAGRSAVSPPESGAPRIPTAAPNAPARPVLVTGSRELAVSWQAAEFAAAYEVWVGTTDNPALAEKYGDDITGGLTETVIKGLINETTYYVWIRANNIIGTSGFSLSASGMPSVFAVLPETPIQPTTVTGSSVLTVTWQPVEGALFYEIWTGRTNNRANAQKHGADVSGTTARLAGLENGTTYYIWVRAKNNIGVGEFSPMVSATPSAFSVAPFEPQIPALIAGSGQITVSWLAVEGAVSYEVWMGTIIDPVAAEKYGNDVSSLSAVITGLTNGVTYYVWIKAKNNAGTSGFSPIASGMPQEIDISEETPAVPVVSLGDGQITVTWIAIPGATAYEVWIAEENNLALAAKYGEDVSTSLFTVLDNLSNGTTYYIWVRAKNNISISEFSPSVMGKPIADVAVPVLMSGNGQLSVTWTEVDGADEYEVFIGTGVNPPQLATQIVTGAEVSITGLVNGTIYNVWVRGRNSTGSGAMRSPASAKPIGPMGLVTVRTGESGELVLNWPAVSGADEYDVLCFYEDMSTPLSSQTVSSTTAVITGLTNGAEYHVWVFPKNANGISAGARISGVPIAAPESLVIDSANQQITVSWEDVPGAVSYQIFYSVNTSIPTAPSFTVTDTNRTITGLTNGTTYYFWVRAVNATGVSAASTMERGTPIGAIGTVTVTVRDSGQLVLNWPAIAGAAEYLIYQSTDTTKPESFSFTNTATSTSRTISSLINGTTYNFWVRARYSNGTMTDASTMRSGTPIGAIGTVTVTVGGSGQLVLNWPAVAGATEYLIYHSTDTTKPESHSLTRTTNSGTISSLTNGTLYRFWVVPRNSNGASTVVSTMRSGTPIGAIGTVTVTAGTSGQLILNWPAVAGATEYLIYQSTSTTMPASHSYTVTTNSRTVSGLINGTTYYFWVVPRNTTGTSTVVSTMRSGTPRL